MTGAEAWAVPAAIGAAAAFGAGNVAEMRAARRARAGDDLHPRLLVELVRDRLWLVGIAASVVGYALQAAALFLAPVVLVQPLIVTELLFALPLAAWLAGVRLGRREFAGAVLVTVGIAVFMLAARPSGDSAQADSTSWIAMTTGVAAAAVLAIVIAERHRWRPMLRAAALAAGASACFGLLSVDTKVVGHQFADDHLRALAHPQPWLLAATAGTGLLLAQTAFRIAPLSVSLPVIDIGEPLIASVLAVVALHEHIGHSAGVVAAAAAGAGLAVAGVVVLNTSPLARAVQREIHPPAGAARGATLATSTE
jgi:drug/metabolite transporter (DMT)-like permease